MKCHLDLCSGIGGFALAARWAGINTIQFCEKEPFCQAVLANNFPGVPIHDDITKFSAESLRGRVDLLTAGFPCQDISAAGKGAGIHGSRSSLWFHVLRVVTECRPAICIFENVPALRTRGMDTIYECMEEAGYSTEAFVVGADDVGGPHSRKRVWIISFSNSEHGETVARMGTFAKRTEKIFAAERNERAGIWLQSKPGHTGMDHGIPDRMDRTLSLGNAVVPQVAYCVIRAAITKP